MTSYRISLGYNSGYEFNGSLEEAWVILKQECELLRRQTNLIVDEARRLDAPETCDKGCCTLAEMAASYHPGSDDLTLRYTNEDAEPGERHVVQLASGSRRLKEHVRRAFCRLVIQAMHRRGIEVNLIVS